MVQKWFNNLFDNRYVQKFIIFIAIYNVCSSYIATRKEWSILKQVINENDNFFGALATLGFEAFPKTFSFVSLLPYSEEYTVEQVKKIASTTIISVIMKYVQSESLLGIIHVDCDIKPNNMIVTTITPTSANIFFADIHDLIWSIAFTICFISAYFLLVFIF